jgi:hypothetical protein
MKLTIGQGGSLAHEAELVVGSTTPLDVAPEALTFQSLRSAFRQQLDEAGSQYFADWERRFGGREFSGLPWYTACQAQVGVFLQSLAFPAVELAMRQTRDKIGVFLNFLPEWQHLASCGDPPFQMPETGMIMDGLNRFAQRYLPSVGNPLPQVNVNSYAIYQFTCLNLIKLGWLADMVKEGVSKGDQACVRACLRAAAQLCQTLAELTEPGGALTVCEPGMVTRVDEVTRALFNAVCPPSLRQCFEQTRLGLFRHLVLQRCRSLYQLHENYANNEVHYINHWQYHIGSEYGITGSLPDPFAGEHMLGTLWQVESMRSYLEIRQTPMAVLGLVAEQCMQDFVQGLPINTTDWTSSILDEAHQKMGEVWGDIPLHALVCWDAESGQICPQVNTSLVQAALIDRIENEPDLQPFLPADSVVKILFQGAAINRGEVSKMPSHMLCYLKSTFDLSAVLYWLQPNTLETPLGTKPERYIPNMNELPADVFYMADGRAKVNGGLLVLCSNLLQALNRQDVDAVIDLFRLRLLDPVRDPERILDGLKRVSEVREQTDQWQLQLSCAWADVFGSAMAFGVPFVWTLRNPQFSPPRQTGATAAVPEAQQASNRYRLLTGLRSLGLLPSGPPAAPHGP